MTVAKLKAGERRIGRAVVRPEWCTPAEPKRGMKAKHIGKGRDGLWYGWSHRAYHGFRTRAAASRFAHEVS